MSANKHPVDNHAVSAPLVRRARADDARAIAALQRTIYEEDCWFIGDGPPSESSLWRRLHALPEASLYLLAKSGQVAVAWLELNRLAPRRLQHVAVLTVAVAKAARRQGLASALLREAYCWSRQVGVQKISLNVRAGNRPAIQLYERQGFVLEGRERRHIFLGDHYEDNLIMAKWLEPHSPG